MRCHISMNHGARVRVAVVLTALLGVWAKVDAAPADHPAWKNEAEQAYKSSDFKTAIDLATKLLAENPKDARAYYLRASSRVELGQATRDLKLIRSGIEDSRESLRVGGTSEVAFYLPYLFGMTSLAQMENRRDHIDTVIKIADQILARGNVKPEDRANVLYQRAGAYSFLKQTDSAVADYRAAIEVSPSHMGAHVALAELLNQAQRYDRAEEIFTQAVQNFSTAPLVFNNRGMFYQQRGKYPEAIADFSKTIEIDPTYYIALTNRGFVQLQQGKYAEAEADFTKSLAVNATQSLAHNLRGTARLSLGNQPGAVDDYSRVLQADAQNAVAHADLAFAKFFGRDFPGALQLFDKALAIDSKLGYLEPWRYWCMVLTGQKDAADKQFDAVFAKAAADREWPEQLLTFLAERSDEQQLVDSVALDDPNRKAMQLCEAYFFMGERRLVKGDRQGAAVAYKEAMTQKTPHLSAFRGSQYQMKAFPK